MELIGRKSHTKLHPGLGWAIFHIPQDTDDVNMFPTFTVLFVEKHSCLCKLKKITRRIKDIIFIFTR